MADDQTTQEAPETGEQETAPTGTPAGEQETPAAKADDLPDAVKEILKKERKAAADADKARRAAEARLKEIDDANKTEAEKLAEAKSSAEKERDEARSELARFRVAADKKLPAELAELLVGTPEEMEAKADVLLQHMKDTQTSETPDFGSGAREKNAEPKKPEEAHQDFVLNLLGRSD